MLRGSSNALMLQLARGSKEVSSMVLWLPKEDQIGRQGCQAPNEEGMQVSILERYYGLEPGSLDQLATTD